jgi:hypothetical protein
MPIVTWQLWLARQLVAQRPLLQAKISDQTYPWTSGSIVWEYFSPGTVHRLNLPNFEVNRTVGPGDANDDPEFDIPQSKKGSLEPKKTTKSVLNLNFSSVDY